ncbi:MAG: hypothetical protein ACLR23_19000 [Clostridia bacterium]
MSRLPSMAHPIFDLFSRLRLLLAALIIAVMALYYAVGRWNEYYNALIYVNKTELMPLQIVLRNILINNQNLLDQLLADPNATEEQTLQSGKACLYGGKHEICNHLCGVPANVASIPIYSEIFRQRCDDWLPKG